MPNRKRGGPYPDRRRARPANRLYGNEELKHTKRTSKSDPLQIATVKAPGIGTGSIGLTLCPGKKDTQSLTGIWHRDLAIDIAAIKEWGAVAVVCLMEAFELEMLKVPELPAAVTASGMLRGDNQGERSASIRLRLRRGWADGGWA